jgi:predicted transposase/invertase (TIGR01784 family)
MKNKPILKKIELGQSVSYDALFRFFFGYDDIALDFTQNFLPKEVVSLIDFSSFVRDETAYVDPKFLQNFADMVFRSRIKGTEQSCAVAFLYEHKSKQPKYIHFQLDRYIKAVHAHDIKNKRAPSFVIPIMVYHGEAPWKYEQMEDYFGGVPDALKPYLASFQYCLTDLSSLPVELINALAVKSFLRNVLLTLKFAFDTDVLKSKLQVIIASSGPLDERHYEQFQSLVNYLLSRTDLQKSEFVALKEDIGEPLKAQIMTTTYENILQAGKLEGKIEGKLEGRLEGTLSTETRLVKNLIKKYPTWSNQQIAEALDLDEHFVASLRIN